MKSLYALTFLIVAVSLSEAASSRIPLAVKSNSRTWPQAGVEAFFTRHRRQASLTMTKDEIREIVGHHNVLRAKEGADNMELMVWNEALATMADKWAAGCSWRHGQPVMNTTPPFRFIGQNLYMVAGRKIDLTSAVQLWYDEKVDFDYDTLQCAANKPCGHYTQVVWSSSREVGCGYHFCPRMLNSFFTNAYYLVCNYGPAGNWRGQKPYTKGRACSKCDRGAGWCKNGLCNSRCTSAGVDCTCAAVCFNCAKLDTDACRCSCADGWRGADCSAVCKDTHQLCGANPGWPPSWCLDSRNGAAIRQRCPAMCQLCTEDKSAVANQCLPIIATNIMSTAATVTAATTTVPADTTATETEATTERSSTPACVCICPP